MVQNLEVYCKNREKVDQHQNVVLNISRVIAKYLKGLIKLGVKIVVAIDNVDNIDQSLRKDSITIKIKTTKYQERKEYFIKMFGLDQQESEKYAEISKFMNYNNYLNLNQLGKQMIKKYLESQKGKEIGKQEYPKFTDIGGLQF